MAKNNKSLESKIRDDIKMMSPYLNIKLSPRAKKALDKMMPAIVRETQMAIDTLKNLETPD